jgi:hypothetical protein
MREYGVLRFRVDVVYSRGLLRSPLAAIVQREGMAGPLVFLAATITELLCVTARRVALPGGLLLASIWQEVKPETSLGACPLWRRYPWAACRFDTKRWLGIGSVLNLWDAESRCEAPFVNGRVGIARGRRWHGLS